MKKMNKEDLENKIKGIINELRPYLNMDGGDIEFIKYEDNYLYVRLTGACESCMLQDNTLNEGILSYFQAQIPELEGVINTNL